MPGAFPSSHRVTEELLRRGERVRTLLRADAPGDPLRPLVDVAPLAFDPSTLRGASRACRDSALRV
jgi:hypothetical protein